MLIKFCTARNKNAFVEALCSPIICVDLSNQNCKSVSKQYNHLQDLNLEAKSTDRSGQYKNHSTVNFNGTQFLKIRIETDANFQQQSFDTTVKGATKLYFLYIFACGHYFAQYGFM